MLFVLVEMKDGMFISHCGASWLEAEEDCKANKATLVPSTQYQSLLQELTSTHITLKDGVSFWTGGFFTPWIWSNGKLQLGSFSNNWYAYTIFT